MAEITSYRNASLTFGEEKIAMIVEAEINVKWDTLSFPVYKDQPYVKTIPTIKNAFVRLRKIFEKQSPLHIAIDQNPVSLVFDADGETHTFSMARVIEWKVSGQLNGDLMEEVVLACESET